MKIRDIAMRIQELKGKLEDPEFLRERFSKTEQYMEDIAYYGKARFDFVEACIESEILNDRPLKMEMLETVKSFDYKSLVSKLLEAGEEEYESCN